MVLAFAVATSGCDGTDGSDGSDGTDGSDGEPGTNALLQLVDEPEGEHCANGGTRVDTGLDRDHDDILDPEEVDVGARRYVCQPFKLYDLRVRITGLAPSGGAPATLLNLGGDPLSLSVDGTYAFATKLITGVGYAVTLTPPADRFCTIVDDSGTAGYASITARVSCYPYWTTLFGGPGQGGFALSLDVAADGRIYAVYGEQIVIFSQSGSLAMLAGSSTPGLVDDQGSAARFDSPLDLVVDGDGVVYVADCMNHRIRRISPSGDVTTFAGSTEGYADGPGTSAQFSCPSGIAIDGDGSLYVADRSNHRIRKISPTGDVTTFAGSSLGHADGPGTEARFVDPSGVVVGLDGWMYVADRAGAIRRISPEGDVTTLAGAIESGYVDAQGVDARFEEPAGIAVDRYGHVYVTEMNRHRVRKVSPSGDVITIGGSTVLGFVDGNGRDARFHGILAGIAIDADDRIYVGDAGNEAIRVIDP